ncbi:WecB/TagA/CpsF family glycosyltransferase [Ketobacter sp.]|uniref:WecB/TagA/CpsF family glycosyltransferase n=1 Tax=Ketobacter sp. TaxID=2083498 RepID=UPI000F12EACD|nr:WecB/TagA/CpsF family glycosyltransferase [Ketobacter sp.]RLT96792.1 MAG: glycosyltransferase [Ketobacter sp.]
MSTLQQQNKWIGWHAEQVLMFPLVTLLSVVWVMNVLLAKMQGSAVLKSSRHMTLSGHELVLRQFTHGILRHSFWVWEILNGRVSLVGMPLNTGRRLGVAAAAQPGLVSLWQLRQLSGLSEAGLYDTVIRQLRYSRVEQLQLLIKFGVAKCLYQQANLHRPACFQLFGMRINNLSMDEAVARITAEPMYDSARVGYFVNVNSFNIAHSRPGFRALVNTADWVFADGSGVRLAAKHQGIALRDNVNGTDMLPKLCEQARNQGLSLYLLGADKGVAEAAAAALRTQFPGLRIAGTEHGYIDHHDSQAVIERINAAGTDILLVGMGSPIQEQWLRDHAQRLHCRSALAVGGLFDFCSGRIPRAPLWMRELGLEWVWRLLQEPKAKFHRYVIGNPQFLFRMIKHS